MTEIQHLYKFLENHKKIRKVVLSSCASYNIKRLIIPLKKIKEFVFDGIDDKRGKNQLHELLKDRAHLIKKLTFKDCYMPEKDFVRLDICVFPKLKKFLLEKVTGINHINEMLRVTNTPVLRYLKVTDLKILDPDIIMILFWNLWECRELHFEFIKKDMLTYVNKGITLVITKIMRKYARFLPLPMCIFNNLKVLRLSWID